MWVIDSHRGSFILPLLFRFFVDGGTDSAIVLHLFMTFQGKRKQQNNRK